MLKTSKFCRFLNFSVHKVPRSAQKKNFFRLEKVVVKKKNFFFFLKKIFWTTTFPSLEKKPILTGLDGTGPIFAGPPLDLLEVFFLFNLNNFNFPFLVGGAFV